MEQQIFYTPLINYLSIVQQYILMVKGVSVNVIPPQNEEEEKKLFLAYDIASYHMSRVQQPFFN